MMIKTVKPFNTSELAFGISYKMRNPVATAKCSIELLKESKVLDQIEKHHINMILRQFTLIDSNLEQLRFLVDPILPDMKKHKIGDIITQVEDVIREKCLSKNVKIEHANGLPAGIHVQADASLILEALLNIAINSIEAMPGGGTLRIDSKFDHDLQTLSLIFKDNGEGMDANTLNAIGQPFFTTKRNSTGMGIARTAKVIEAHSSQMTFESHPGEGTTVTFTFPAVKENLKLHV